MAPWDSTARTPDPLARTASLPLHLPEPLEKRSYPSPFTSTETSGMRAVVVWGSSLAFSVSARNQPGSGLLMESRPPRGQPRPPPCRGTTLTPEPGGRICVHINMHTHTQTCTHTHPQVCSSGTGLGVSPSPPHLGATPSYEGPCREGPGVCTWSRAPPSRAPNYLYTFPGR